MPISWYPGHMRKARRELAALLRGAKLALEVLDARIPAASANPLLSQLRGELPVVRVLNKSDLADPARTAAWLSYYGGSFGGDFSEGSGLTCLANGRDAPLKPDRLLGVIDRLGGGSPTHIRDRGEIAIIGIPNVGKSSLLNQLSGRKLAKTGNTPALTRVQQAAPFAENWRLIDTPGMLRPKLEDQRGAGLMACVGSIGAKALDIETVAGFLADCLLAGHRGALVERYGLAPEVHTAEALFDTIAASRGARRKGGGADLERAAEILLGDFRAGRLGRITLESPPANDPETETGLEAETRPEPKPDPSSNPKLKSRQTP